jgi:2-methylisocitrate lyase-like PEP mutase family enzyme
VEAPKSVRELEEIGKALRGVPQMTNMFEGDKERPWLTPKELGKLGFSMILYSTTLLFRVVRCLERALADLGAGRQMPQKEGVPDRIRKHCRTGALGRDRKPVSAWERAVKIDALSHAPLQNQAS